jgi:hypothetical protein
MLIASSCTDKKQIESDIAGTKRQIELIDNEILQLQKKKSRHLSFNNEVNDMVVRIKIDPEIYKYERARELLLIKLESLYQKL